MNGVGDIVRPIHEFSFEGLFLMRVVVFSRKVEIGLFRSVSGPLLGTLTSPGPKPRVLKASGERGPRQVDALDIWEPNSQFSDNAERLRITFKSVVVILAHQIVENVLTNMTKGWVSQVMSYAGGLYNLRVKSAIFRVLLLFV